MLLPDFKAAQLPTPRGRSPDPNWLEGLGRGQTCFLVGGAGGLVESPGIRLAEGHVVIGSNWTLQALVPSIWTVFDIDVWKDQRSHLAGCPDSMACVVNKSCFGGGPYSTTHSRLLRMVGSGQRRLTEISIKQTPGGVRLPNGVFRAAMQEPFMPDRIADPWHRGANSLCYQIQLAHLMGFSRILCMGFTLQSGLGYFFGRTNPVTKKVAFYDQEVPLHWLSWYETHWPGRARLLPGWSGPVYDVLQTEGFDDAEARLRGLREDGSPAQGIRQTESDAESADRNPGTEERLGQDSDGSAHSEGPSETPAWW